MGKLQGNDAALVAAALTQAEAAMIAGGAATDTGLRHLEQSKADVLVRTMYERHLAYVTGYDLDKDEGSVAESLLAGKGAES